MGSIPHSPVVYQILCVPTGKIYVGSSIDLNDRCYAHFYRLSRQQHGNPHLQAAWNHYGPEHFVFEVLEYCDASNLVEREEWYIHNTRCREREYGFNVGAAGYATNTGRKMPPRSQTWRDHISRLLSGKPKSPESVAKMRETKTGKPNPHAAKRNARTYLVTDPDGNSMIVTNLAAFCREYGLSHSGMLNVASRNKHQSYKGWRCVRIDPDTLQPDTLP